MSDDKQEIHLEAIQRFQASFAAEESEREKALDDMQFVFVPGSQWDNNTNQRTDRPRFEINKIALPLNQLIGEQRQNRISVKVRATKGAKSKKSADLFAGLVRRIEQQSNFTNVKDTAFKELSSGGIGAWYVTTGFTSNDSFDQDIMLKTITSAASSVYYDPSAQEELKQDASWVMVTQDVARSVFKKKYPDAASGSGLSTPLTNNMADWQTRDTVRIADYWVKEPVRKTLALLSDDTIVELEDNTAEAEAELAATGITIVKSRKKMSHKVVMYKISSAEILEGPLEWAGQYIPVVPVFGYNVWINGNHYYKGMVRMARDAQRVYNYATSEAIEISAISPKDPIWLTPKQAIGHEAQLKNFNLTNNPFLLYNADPSAPGIPQRSGAPAVQQALISQIQQAAVDIQSTTGQHQPSLGESAGEQSGRAILALQRKGTNSTHELIDNLRKAVEYTGKILVDLIPHIYDTERTMSILDETNDTSEVTLNEHVFDNATGETKIENDMKSGKFDVISTAGPSYATERSEGLNMLTTLAQTSPMFADIAADLMAESIDFPFSEELTKRVRKRLIAQGIVEPNEEELEVMQASAPQGPSPVEQLNFEMLKLQVEQQAALVDSIELANEREKAKITELGAKTDETVAKTENTRADTQKTLTDVIETKTDINTKLANNGNDARMPIEPAELAVRQMNMQVLSDSLEVAVAEIDQVVQAVETNKGQLPPVQ